MGSIIPGGCYATPRQLNDLGLELGDEETITDPKELLKYGLIEKWEVTKGLYG